MRMSQKARVLPIEAVRSLAAKDAARDFGSRLPFHRLAAAHSRLLNASRWAMPGAYVYVPESVSAGH